MTVTREDSQHIKKLIREDIDSGRIPAHEATSFSRLHDFVDANEYLLAVLERRGEDYRPADRTQADFMNELAEEVNQWLGWETIIAAAKSLESVQDAQVWHSGGGIWGVLVTLRNRESIFFGNADGGDNWGYDHNGADWEHLSSGYYNAAKWSLAEWAADVIGS